MNSKLKIISDNSRHYEPNTLITSDELIDDFIAVCNNEDSDLLGWLFELKLTNKQDLALDIITDYWNIKLEKII